MLLQMVMWHARWKASKVFCYLRHVSIRQRAQNNIWKHLEVHSMKKKWMMIRRNLQLYSMWASQDLYCQLSQVATAQGFQLVRGAT